LYPYNLLAVHRSEL